MLTTEAQLERLRRKYKMVLREMEEEHVNLILLSLRNDKLYVNGAVQSREALERIRSRFSDVDREWSSEVELDLHAPGELQPHTGQTVVNHAEDFLHASDDTGESD